MISSLSRRRFLLQSASALALGNDLFHPRKTNSILTAHDGLYHFYCAVPGSWPHDIRGISVARPRPF